MRALDRRNQLREDIAVPRRISPVIDIQLCRGWPETFEEPVTWKGERRWPPLLGRRSARRSLPSARCRKLH